MTPRFCLSLILTIVVLCFTAGTTSKAGASSSSPNMFSSPSTSSLSIISRKNDRRQQKQQQLLLSTVLSLRGGARLKNLNREARTTTTTATAVKTTATNAKAKGVKPQQRPKSKQSVTATTTTTKFLQSHGSKTLLTVMGTSVVGYIVWKYRAILFNKQEIQSQTLDVLNRLNKLPKYKSYTIYVAGMSLWECIGLSTIPVETASGMVFGWPYGFYLNAIGKLCGACLAFAIGRYSSFASRIKDQSTFLQLVESSAESHPWLVSFLMKFSCLPETIKNVGAGILQPGIHWHMFIVSTMVHGWMFSALWTYLGVDTVARIDSSNSGMEPNRRLQFLLTLALINGIVVSPLSMVYWVRSLKQQNDRRKKKKGRKGTTKKRAKK